MFFYEISANFEPNESMVDNYGRIDIDIPIENKDFNSHNSERFVFVVSARKESIHLGYIGKTKPNETDAADFMSVLGFNFNDIKIRQLTFGDLNDYLSEASRYGNGGIISRDILRKYGLLMLARVYGRGCDYDECIIDSSISKSLALKEAKKLCSPSLYDEIGRIYVGKTVKKSIGHPVHYIIHSDNSTRSSRMVDVLLNSLYQTGRITSRLYNRVNVDDIQYDFQEAVLKNSVGGAIVINCPFALEIETDIVRNSTEKFRIAMECMQKYQNDVLTIICIPKKCSKIKNIMLSYAGTCSFVEISEDVIFGEDAKNYLRQLALDAGIKGDKSLYNYISDSEKGYTINDLTIFFENWRGKTLRQKVYPQYAAVQTVGKQIVEEKPRGSAYNELQQMIGLTRAKAVIEQAINYYKAQKLFKDRGLQPDRPAMNMVFTGNPGTAKTTVARLFAQIMKENNVLTEGALYEVGRADLVGKYVGWTAKIVKDKFKQAKGSVLFIDEAYSLLDDREGMFGDEAINTIVQEMENNRENVIVIFAGYPKEMEQFLSRNPGLSSRIAFHIPFDDYNSEELYQITEYITKQKNMTLANGTKDKLLPIFDNAIKSKDFGNGRYARNLVETAKMKQADRLIKSDIDALTTQDIQTLLPEDFEAPTQLEIQKTKIGF